MHIPSSSAPKTRDTLPLSSVHHEKEYWLRHARRLSIPLGTAVADAGAAVVDIFVPQQQLLVAGAAEGMGAR
jgi:hypothetical protein